MERSESRRTTRGGGSLQQGTVVRLHARHARVRVESGTLHCTLRKALFRDRRMLTQPIAVGDQVSVRVWGPRDAVVEEVHERRSCISRSWQGSERQQVLVANVDCVFAVSALANPAFRPRLIDRLLVAAEREDLQAVVVLNKVDLVADRAAVGEWAALYESAGYAVLLTSAETGEGVDVLREHLTGKTSVVAGHSGVGKSSLLNAVQPGLELRTGEVSGKWNKGRHVTTAVSLLDLQGGGFVADTPGIRAFGVTGLETWQVGLLFPEVRALAPDCRFPTCSHTHEPECAVKDGLESGRIDPRRFESYLRIVEGEEDWLTGEKQDAPAEDSP